MHRQAGKTKTGRGLTIPEVLLVLLVVPIVLVALKASSLSSAKAEWTAQDTSRGASLLQAVMEDLRAQPYDALLSRNGQRIFDKGTQRASNWSVDLAVFQAGADLLQVDAALTDLQSTRVIAQLCTLRSRR